MSSHVPQFSILIPARDEEKNIGSCIEAVMRSAEAAAVSYEIIVILNRCTDRTEDIAREKGCRIVREDAKNLSKIRNAGAKAARGEILLTVDADSRFSRNLLSCVQVELETGKSIGGGVLILPERWSLGIFCSGLLLLPIAFYYRIQAGVFFLRRTDFEAIGGFDERLLSAEDIDFAIRLRRHGKAQSKHFSLLLRAHIVTSCRKFDVLGDWYFLKNFRQTLSLLRGQNEAAANQIWYDFKR
ncbi:MAG: glycosyltransferase [Bdellovibrionales bacterium]|nr:glycosyltransferase [Bdellovibrionales bacterium]